MAEGLRMPRAVCGLWGVCGAVMSVGAALAIIRNLLIYHTEDRNLPQRKAMYLREGSQYYHGALWIPDDLETITL